MFEDSIKLEDQDEQKPTDEESKSGWWIGPVFSNRRMSLKEAKGRRSRVFVLSGFER